jgi:hypothetical protein
MGNHPNSAIHFISARENTGTAAGTIPDKKGEMK